MKQLHEMTGGELGRLFPITISDPNPEWGGLFNIEKNKILKNLGSEIITLIEHIGSTAVAGLPAKPIIDILIQIEDDSNQEIIINKLHSLGYQYIQQPENPPPHMTFVKGYTLNGYYGQAFHIHIRYKGDWDEIIFRDYLMQNHEIAQQYAELKIHLSVLYRNDRDGYTEAKTEFIKKVTAIARSKSDV